MVCDECGCGFTEDEWGLFDACPICYVGNQDEDDWRDWDEFDDDFLDD